MTAARRYVVRIKRSAVKEMDALPRRMFDRLAAAILALENDPRPRGGKKLRGTEQHRIRCGDYRILYTVDDHQLVVEIVAIGHRREVYRDLS